VSVDRPPFVSEREGSHTFPTGVHDGPADEDCVFAAGLMQAEAMTGNRLPATLEEAERIRAAAGLGPDGPSNSDDLIRGMRARYGFAPRKIAGFAAFDFDDFWNQLGPGMCATVGGKISNFPAGHNLARFLPNFDGGHRVYVQRETAADAVWWMDPEGRPVATYAGDPATKHDLRTFMHGGSGATIDRIGRLREPMVRITSDVPIQVTTHAGAQYLDLNGNEASRAIQTTVRISPWGIEIPGHGTDLRLLKIHRASLDQDQLLVVRPDPTGQLVQFAPVPGPAGPAPDPGTPLVPGG
jgi:hypothetical protein